MYVNFFYKESKSKKKNFFFLGGGGGSRGGGVDGRTDKQQAKTNLPLQLLRSWAITMHKCTSYGQAQFMTILSIDLQV